MDNLVQFLRDRLDEDSRIAVDTESATEEGLHWYEHQRMPGDGRWTLIDEYDEDVAEVNCSVAGDAAVARHIARHDPTRVLREVEAKKEQLAAYTTAVDQAEEAILLCKQSLADGKSMFMPEARRMTALHRRDVLHEVLHLLALPYADHPDYRQEWRP
ncbi:MULTISPECIES: DUF6221 family protein [Streptomyces]|uniref:DUF6221 family protein n=1 Tax=Streptomyces flavovirens TaxID=52258 RepID=A0ABV8NDU6_9ACTN|nr:DUF6221 family protein [Streptomyces sp. MBT51]MBK3596734.1 hypothetical protein [Streptomyces sp. MBT51]